MLGDVLGQHHHGVATGGHTTGILVVQRKTRCAPFEFAADHVGDDLEVGGCGEKNAGLAGPELLARLIPIHQLHAAFGDKTPCGLEGTQAHAVVETGLLGPWLHQFPALLVDQTLK